MSIVLAYDRAAAGGGLEARDVFDQIAAVEAALARDGLASRRLPAGLDLASLKPLLAPDSDLVFNLVESIDGADRMQAVFAMALEEWRVPFTGSGSRAMVLSNHKALSKKLLAAAGVFCPACRWLDAAGRLDGFPAGETETAAAGEWIVKPLEMHASLHIDDASVGTFADPAELTARLHAMRRRHGIDFFAERFIRGREFNISLIETDGRATPLPPAEIEFVGFPPGKPKIVGYAAKWDEASVECRDTRRAFGTLAGQPDLERRLTGAALAAWRTFGLSGYARVDFRVDGEGRPFVLEANANPCLSPDAGFAAAAREQGWDYRELCRLILAAAEKGVRPS